MIRAVNNTVIVRPSYEPLRRLSKFAQTEEETIQTKEFGPVKVGNAHHYDNTSPPNSIAWGEVMSVGRGAAWMQNGLRLDKTLRIGDIIGFDQCQQVSLEHESQTLFFLPVNAALCTFNPGEALPRAIGAHILTKEEEGIGERFTLKAQKHGLALPRILAGGEMRVSDSVTSKVKFAVERVINVGTGGMALSEKFKEAVPIRPDPESVGLAAIFMLTMHTDVRVHGVRYRLVCWDRVRGLAED